MATALALLRAARTACVPESARSELIDAQKKGPTNRSAQRNFRVRREAYVKEVEKYHGIYVAESVLPLLTTP